uniref:Uncharacterized protein n=1 Tax=Lactuca sativa TaxID=4236 RepID=A0A9R1XR56_LACSA|nr:hypothetical protein LSAT_V11C100030360 [Lactuca sativa]
MDEENQPQMNDFWDFDYQTDAFVQDGSENQPQSNMDSSGKQNVIEGESKEGSETEQEVMIVIIGWMKIIVTPQMVKVNTTTTLGRNTFHMEYMMKRICKVINVKQKCVCPLTPIATKIMEKNEAAATRYIAEWCGDEKYQVKGPWNDQHVVDMHERVEPIKGRALWPRSECPMQITPPPHRNQPGRPKRKRRQSMEERSQSKSQSQSLRSDVGLSGIHGHGLHGSGKLTRKFVSVTYSKCGNKGHNSRTCKGQGGT